MSAWQVTKANMMIFYLITLLIITSFGEPVKLFNSDEIIEKENDPNRDTRFDEYIVRFNRRCIRMKQIHRRDIIEEFLDKFECYKKNKDVTDKYPDTTDHWIRMDKIIGCDDEDEMELELEDYCIISIIENENIYADGINQCTSRSVSDALYNLDQGTPYILNGFEYIEYDPLFEPDMVIIVVDTGIDYTHPEFDGIHYELLFDAYPFDSLGDHGTHVAGTIVGKNYGVVRAQNTRIKLIDVAVLNGGGGASWTDMYNALDAITNYLTYNTTKKAIINFSLGGGNTVGINERMLAIREAGGISVTSAGNSNWDAKYFTPASSNDSITVGSHDDNNTRSDWTRYGSQSNYGDIIDIWAPGTAVLSALPNNGSARWPGTSMAAPFVSGVAANILANNPDLDYDGVKQRLLNYAVYDIDDRLGRIGLPRAQTLCDEYCDRPGSFCGSGSGGCTSDSDCDDGIFCNGEEYCSEGQCYSGEEVDCGFACYCDTIKDECVRDCDTFDIESYLQCSASFVEDQSSIIEFNEILDDYKETVKYDTIRVNALEGTISENEDDIDDIDILIEKLVRQCNETNDKIDRFGRNYDPNIDLYGSNSNGIYNDFLDNIPNDSDSMIKIVQIKNILIIGLLIINAIITIYNCMYKRNKNNHSKVSSYPKVDYQFSEDDTELSDVNA